MATDAEKQVYPNATPDGKTIPYDIGRPLGSWIASFLSASASAGLAFPTDWELVVLYATENCMIHFAEDEGDAEAEVATGTVLEDHQFVPKFTPISIILPYNGFSVRGLGANGTLYIQAYKRWQGVSINALMGQQ